MHTLTNLKTLIPQQWRQQLREIQMELSLTHLHGPSSVAPMPDEAVVTCLVKDAEFYIDQFIEHYFRLGFAHICFLDNGSTDSTVDRATSYDHVTVYRCVLPVGSHQGLLKRQLAERTVRSGWCLDVDVDEFFDYPYSEVLPLPMFLDHLNRGGYTAVVTQMLDMFADRPLSSLMLRQQEDLRDVYRYYDISHVTRTRYPADPLTIVHGGRNLVSNTEAVVQRGGIRMSVWGVNCCLTKHSLFRTGAGLQLFPHVHYVNGATLADVAGVLLHYKFTSHARDEAVRNQSAFTAISQDYARVVDTINRRPGLRIKANKAVEFRCATELLESGFLFASEEYQAYARVCRPDIEPRIARTSLSA